jgi:hypothetical protein
MIRPVRAAAGRDFARARRQEAGSEGRLRFP